MLESPGAPKSGSGSHPGDRAFFIRGTCKSAQYGHLWGGPQEEFQNQVLAAPLAAMFSFSEEHVKTVPFRNLWGGDPRRASKITLKAISFCFLEVFAVWVPKITLKHEKSLRSQGLGSDFYVFPRGFRFLDAQSTRKHSVLCD